MAQEGLIYTAPSKPYFQPVINTVSICRNDARDPEAGALAQ